MPPGGQTTSTLEFKWVDEIKDRYKHIFPQKLCEGEGLEGV